VGRERERERETERERERSSRSSSFIDSFSPHRVSGVVVEAAAVVSIFFKSGGVEIREILMSERKRIKRLKEVI
jgi:hypothetical protein